LIGEILFYTGIGTVLFLSACAVMLAVIQSSNVCKQEKFFQEKIRGKTWKELP